MAENNAAPREKGNILNENAASASAKLTTRIHSPNTCSGSRRSKYLEVHRKIIGAWRHGKYYRIRIFESNFFSPAKNPMAWKNDEVNRTAVVRVCLQMLQGR